MQVKTDHGIKFYGFYRGQVIQHLGAGKCKIFIPGVYPDACLENPKMVPDAEQASPLFGGVNKGNGMFSYPNIDSIVWCFFENGDQNRPVYFAATLGGENPTDAMGEGFTEVRDNVQIDDENPENDTTRNGFDSSSHMINCGDTRVMIRETGQVVITCETVEEGQYAQIFIDESGVVKIETTTSMEINTPSLKIDAQDQLEINTTSFVLRANNETHINSPQMSIGCENQFRTTSPNITMDASAGTFKATSKTKPALFLT